MRRNVNSLISTMAGPIGFVIFLAVAMVTIASQVHAAASIRVEWIRGGHVYGAQTITTTGSTPVATSAAPDFGGSGLAGQARIVNVGGAAVFTWGPNASATQTNGIRIQAQDTPITVNVNAGDVVSLVEATDAVAGAGGSGGGGAVTGAFGSFADGWNQTEGSTTDGPCASSTTACGIDARLAHIEAQEALNLAAINALNTTAGAALAAGTNNIGSLDPAPHASTDASGTVTTGGTFQTVFASSGSRKGCTIQNPITATETLFVHANPASATTANSFGLAPGATFSCQVGHIVITDAISVTATTTAHAFAAQSQ